ncbi:MAG: hypothetical protein EP344_04350, partial [Bacteroidetes bacterium]
MINLRTAVARGICIFSICLIPALAFGQSESVGRGGTLVAGPAFGGIDNLTFELENATGVNVSNVTIHIAGSYGVKITSVDIVEAPGNLEDQDAVDDNRNGTLEPGENDNNAAPPGNTCTTILKTGLIPNDSTVGIAVRFDLNLPPNTLFVVYFSTDLNGIHYELAMSSSPESPSDIDRSGEFVFGPQFGGINSTTAYLKNDTDEEVSNVTIFLPEDVRIISADITEGPGDVEDQDAVDDNRNGKLDPGETDRIASPGGRTVTIILKEGKIPKGGVIEVALRFDKDLPPQTIFGFYFSKE